MRSAAGRAAVIASIVALAAAAFSLDALGRSRRVIGPAHALSSGHVPVVTIESADEAYRAWKAKGLHGRVVLSLSSRLYFVAPDRGEPLPSTGRGPVNPAEAAERALDPRNLLLVAMEQGVAREVRHVLPARAYVEKVALARGEEGVELAGGVLSAPWFGSPRRLTTLGPDAFVAEPVLLFVSASIFADQDAADVWRRLSSLGLSSDLVVLCRSRDDPQVDAAQREQLDRFAALMGAP